MQIIILNIIIVTPLLFVFGETLPKDLFSTYADKLMYRLAPVLVWSQRAFQWTGLLLLVTGFTLLLNRLLRGGGVIHTLHPRRQMSSLVREGVAQGILSDEQSAMVERVLAMAGKRLEGEMIPWQKVATVQQSDHLVRLRQLAERSGHTRFPVIDNRGKVVGVVSVFEALLSGQDENTPVTELMSEPLEVNIILPIQQALRQMQNQAKHMAIVTRNNRPVGIVTVKDLVEPITGELMDW